SGDAVALRIMCDPERHGSAAHDGLQLLRPLAQLLAALAQRLSLTPVFSDVSKGIQNRPLATVHNRDSHRLGVNDSTVRAAEPDLEQRAWPTGFQHLRPPPFDFGAEILVDKVQNR